MPYSTVKIAIFVVIIYTILTFCVLMVIICTRNKSKLNITNNKKIVCKVIGLIITLTNFLMFVPMFSMTTAMFYCFPEEKACYKGTHLIMLCFSVIAFIIHLILAFFSEALMTSSYPNETICWSHFPSKLQYMKTFFKIATIIVFKADSK